MVITRIFSELQESQTQSSIYKCWWVFACFCILLSFCHCWFKLKLKLNRFKRRCPCELFVSLCFNIRDHCLMPTCRPIDPPSLQKLLNPRNPNTISHISAMRLLHSLLLFCSQYKDVANNASHLAYTFSTFVG